MLLFLLKIIILLVEDSYSLYLSIEVLIFWTKESSVVRPVPVPVIFKHFSMQIIIKGQK